MPVLMWVAVLVAGWCAASIVAAISLGSYLRGRAEVTDPDGALSPLDTGPLRLWLGELPEVPDDAAALTRGPAPRRSRFDGLVAGLPAPRAAQDTDDRHSAVAR